MESVIVTEDIRAHLERCDNSTEAFKMSFAGSGLQIVGTGPSYYRVDPLRGLM